MKKKLLFSGMIALAMGFTAANAQLYNYTNDLGGVPASTATNTTGSNLARVDGALPITGCPDGFNSNKYSEATTFGVTRPSVEFSISPNTGYQLDVTSVSVNARRNNKGPALWRFAYSIDGGATWTNNGSDYSVTAVTCGTSNTLTWDMPDFSSEGTVLVRVYSYGATSALNGVGTLTNLVLSGGVSYADIDNDGYTSDVDCDDNNADINPGASETCNGIDDNCSGTADEGVTTTYYADADGDTYGDAGSTTEACSMPEGYVSDNTDCNDGNADINPAASEVCNGIDDNCDGNNDEGLTFETWYADMDGDTYGDAGNTVSTCDGTPEGYVADNTDCNDGDGAVNPGASEVCNGVDDNCDGNTDEGVTTTFYADADGDTYGDAGSTTEACSAPEGYVADNTDCNDGDGAVNPGASEVCNGVDDNCDGNTDEGVTTTFYADADGDTYGDAGSTTEACSAPEGYVSDNTDCNDADGAVNPGATEVCNGVDDNCDGNTDEGVTTTFYADADGDTYGDAGSTTEACSAPEGYVSDNTDCNDADGAVNPGAAEVCNGIDDNCDGNTDEGVLSTFYADADGDTYGDAGSTTEACSAPEGYVADNTDCNDGDGSINPGAAEICNGIDENCDGNIDEGVLTTFYADGDGDTYGDDGMTAEACSAPEGYVAMNGDCNDADAAVNPAATEVCGNGIDDDCDGYIDLTATIVAEGATTICTGGSVTLTSTTGGTGLSYQWKKNGNNIAGATSASYVATETGNYRCVVTKPTCYSSSSPITVTVVAYPAATINPLDGLDLCGRPNVRLRANNIAGVTYQWYLDGSPISGATNILYYATATGNYQVQVTNATGCSTMSAISTVFSSCRLGNTEVSANLNIMPNPSKGAFDIQFSINESNATTAHVMVMNLAGQTVVAFDAEVVGGKLQTSVEMAPVAGAYLLVVQLDGAVYTERLIISE